MRNYYDDEQNGYDEKSQITTILRNLTRRKRKKIDGYNTQINLCSLFLILFIVQGRPKAICQEIPQRNSKSPANTKESTAARAKRRRLRKEQENGGGDICARLTSEKQELAALILSEINRKIASVVWRP